jgi:Xaa-Pro aminopeptidase
LAKRNLSGFIIRAPMSIRANMCRSGAAAGWISGFTGSPAWHRAHGSAAIFVDGRYTVQVRAETDPKLFEYRHLIEEPPSEWIAAISNPATGSVMTHGCTRPMQFRCSHARREAGAVLVACPDSPLDRAWTEQPPAPIAPVVPLDERYTGRSSAEKRREVGSVVAKAGADAAVLTQPTQSLASEHPRRRRTHTPLPLSFAILESDGRATLFMDQRKLAPETRAHLGNEVAVEPRGAGPALDRLGKEAPAFWPIPAAPPPGSSTGCRPPRRRL